LAADCLLRILNNILNPSCVRALIEAVLHQFHTQVLTVCTLQSQHHGKQKLQLPRIGPSEKVQRRNPHTAAVTLVVQKHAFKHFEGGGHLDHGVS